MDPRTESTIEAAREVGAEWALLTAPDTVMYAAQHESPIEMGPSPFNGGPTTALVGPDGAVYSVCNELERPAAEASAATEIRDYVSLGFSDQRPIQERYVDCLRATFASAGVTGKVAVEATLPDSAAAVVGEHAEAVPFDDQLWRRRAIKTPSEVELLQRCADATGLGHEAAFNATRPGDPELKPWREVRYAMEEFAGIRTPIAGDFVTGKQRTANVGGMPTDRVIEEGDPVICDLAPRIEGYWADSCTTFLMGPPTPEYQEMYDLVYTAFERVLELLRPGIVAGELDDEIRGMITSAGYANPVHLGHGIGTSVHEWPRVIPGQTATLEPGMVLLFEPGAYHPDVGGVRLEKMFEMTDTGYRVMSPFEFSEEIPQPVS